MLTGGKGEGKYNALGGGERRGGRIGECGLTSRYTDHSAGPMGMASISSATNEQNKINIPLHYYVILT